MVSNIQIKVRIHKFVALFLLAAFFGPVSAVVAPELSLSSANAAQGLNIYFRSYTSSDYANRNATNQQTFTTGTCATATGNLNYTTDSNFPSGCSAYRDYFQGYATGYFIAPITGSITFYVNSDDSAEVDVTNDSGTINRLQISDCCRTQSATYSGFTAGKYYAFKSFFTEIGGAAYWSVYYSWTAQNGYAAQTTQTVIPATAFSTTPQGYTVTFNANNGSGSPSVSSVQQSSSGAAVTLATVGTLARTGYTFAGWSTSATPNSNIGNLAAGSSYTPSGDITLYAQWNSTISYDSNTATSGTVPAGSTAYSSAANTNLATNSGNLAKTGYTFGGWNTARDGSGTTYTSGASGYTSLGSTTLYAQWNSVITYMSNGGTSGSAPPNQSLYGTTGTLYGNTTALSKTNYTLAGWNTNETGTGTSYALGGTITPSGNMTLYARWVSIVSYYGNGNSGGSVPADTTISASGGNIATNSGSLTKTSKVFAGWNTAFDGTGTWYPAGASYSNTGNLVLYARWVDALNFTGPTSINVSQGSTFRSDTYTATAGLDTKTVTYTLSPSQAGISLETATVTGTTYAYIRATALVPSGTYTETLTATDRAGATASVVVTLIFNTPLQWAAGIPTTLRSTFGSAKQLRLDVTGGFGNKVFTLTTGKNHSKGISLDTSTAASGYVTLKISGQTAEGIYPETITVTDVTGRQITTAITVTVGAPISFVRSGVVLANAYSSTKFDGTSQYLTAPASSRYQIGSSWTAEWWQYQTGGGDSATVFGIGPNWGFYFDKTGTKLIESTFSGPQNLVSNLVPANYKNKWTHFAIVSNGTTGYVYVDGIAMNATALNMSVFTLNSNQAPSTSPMCIATRCSSGTTGDSGYFFGGMITNLSISKRVDYTGTSTTTANFTPSASMKIDSMTVLALTGINSASTLSDISPYVDSFTASNGPVGTFEYPKRTGITPVVVETTDGRPASPTATQATNGENYMSTLTMTANTPGLSYRNFNLYFAVDGSYAEANLLSTVTSIDSVTARTTYDTLTATDPYGGTASIPYKFTVNPRLQLAATTLTLTTPALVVAYDTITATFGTGNKSWTTVNSLGSGISKTYPTNSQVVIKVGPTTPKGTYYETVTVTDERGDTETVVITVNVTPGLTLTAVDSVTSITTTKGTAKSLRINATNGSGAKTFTLTHVALGSLYITLDTSTAGSDYVTLNVGTAVNAGSYTERITATDAVGSRISLDISLTVNAAPTISYAGATSGAITFTTTAGTALTSNAFTAAGGTGTRILSLSGLNSGITLDTSTANIGYVTAGSSLTATNSTTARSYYDTMTVTDSLTSTAIRAFTVLVNPAISLAATSISLTTTSGVSITDTITATQGTGNKTFAITSSPSISGITNTTNILNQTTLTIPNTVGAGTYTITVTATDSVGATSSINVTLTVNGGVVVTGSGSIAMTTGYAYNSGSYSVTGGTGSYSYALTGTLNSTFISLETLTARSFRLKITSSATAATYSETVTVTDAAGAKGIINVTLTINPVVTLSGNQTINGTFGVGSTTVYQTIGGTAPFSIFGSNSCAPVVSTDGSYTVLKFIGVGTCNWTVPNGVSSVEALVVAGGGAGGTRAGGGGGAGGVQTDTSYSVSALSNISVTVGDGGKGELLVRGSNGGNSAFGSIASSGGGSGGGAIGENINNIYRKGADGGSGGGGAGSNGSSSAPAGSGIAGQGFGGGLSETNQYWPGGGGGGATSAGAKPSSNTSPAGKGGSGYLSSITGIAVCYATGGGAGTYKNIEPPSQGYLTTAGEAGAGGDCGSAASPNGGSGTSGSTTPAPAVPNSGAGGGGSGWSSLDNQVGGDGASGVVIVRYLTPTVTTPNLITYVVETYTASGKIIVTLPDSVTVGTYTENLTIKDAAGTSTTYTITINIAKATPTVALAIPGGGSAATYGSPVSLTATSSTAGTATFKNGGTDLSGCVGKATSGGSASCNWTPTDTSTVTMTAAFTPADTTNYNSVTTSNFVLSVNQADTLTVSFTNQSFTFSESGTAVSRAFTLSGLTSIDTVTAVATAITGTANDSTSVNVTGTSNSGAPGTSSVTKAGTFSLSGTAVTFSGSTKSSYYKAIAYAPGTITINKAGNPMTVNYGTNNTITYKLTGTETPTVTNKGTGTKSFSTASSSYCTLDNATGALITLQSGSCDVSFAVAESANYLGDTVTATVRIYKATRTITASSAASSLKYGETTTISGTISAETASATLSISVGSTTGCSIDPNTGVLTAISGTATCSFTIEAAEDNKYLSATSNLVSVTLNKADAPVVTLIAPANQNYLPSATSADMPLPTFTVTGLKFSDTLTAISGITINYVATGTYSYNSTTVPTGANTYALTPTAITLSSGSMNNYNTSTFTSVNWTIYQINQDTFTVKSLFQEGITVPYDLQYSGGSTNGSVTGQILPGGTATGCSFTGINLQASSTGTCLVRLKKAGNQNYFDVYSDTFTVLIANFKQNTFNFDAPPAGTVIAINSAVPVTKGPDACTSNCQPKITGVSATELYGGDPLTITGTNFATATEVIFNLDFSVFTFTVDGTGTTIAVTVPSGVDPGSGGINVRSPSGLSPMYLGITFR